MIRRIRQLLSRRRQTVDVGEPQRAPRVVRAAGGVIERDGHVLVVHRPKYDDWTFPKGKNDRGETDADCAVREVEEETGLRPELVEELTSVDYVDRKGRPKTVRYWLMRAEGEAIASNEVDEVRWVAPDQARWLLSYERDRDVLDAFLERA